MKQLLLVSVIFFVGCLPASQQEVQELTNAVSAIIPAVQAAVSNESAETQEDIGIILGRVEEINTAVATAENPIEVIESGWNATEAWNPYYGYGVLALGIWRLLAGRQKDKKAIEEIVLGVEAHKNGLGDLKTTLTATESLNTRKMVKKILS